MDEQFPQQITDVTCGLNPITNTKAWPGKNQETVYKTIKRKENSTENTMTQKGNYMKIYRIKTTEH